MTIDCFSSALFLFWVLSVSVVKQRCCEGVKIEWWKTEKQPFAYFYVECMHLKLSNDVQSSRYVQVYRKRSSYLNWKCKQLSNLGNWFQVYEMGIELRIMVPRSLWKILLHYIYCCCLCKSHLFSSRVDGSNPVVIGYMVMYLLSPGTW